MKNYFLKFSIKQKSEKQQKSIHYSQLILHTALVNQYDFKMAVATRPDPLF